MHIHVKGEVYLFCNYYIFQFEPFNRSCYYIPLYTCLYQIKETERVEEFMSLFISTHHDYTKN